MVAPEIPGLTDHETPAILKAAADAGARCAGYTIGAADGSFTLFQDWLEHHFPGRKEKCWSGSGRCETVVSTILASE